MMNMIAGLAILVAFLYFPYRLITGILKPQKYNAVGDRKEFIKRTIVYWAGSVVFLSVLTAIILSFSGKDESKVVAQPVAEPQPAIEPKQATPVVQNTAQSTVAQSAVSVKTAEKSQPKPVEKPVKNAKIDLETTTKDMDFPSCVALQNETARTLLSTGKYNVVNIVNSDILTIKRMCTNDGSVLVTCSKPDHKMILTKSPHRDGC